MVKTYFSLAFLAFFLTACSDNASVTIYDAKAIEDKIPCMRLVVFPPEHKLQEQLESLYAFDARCNFKLEVSKKSGIVCNSQENAGKKALAKFPSAYVKMTLYKENSLVYGYYKDLDEEVEFKDIEDAFMRVQKDLRL